MKAIKTYNHLYTKTKETCIAVFRIGKFSRLRDLECYKNKGDVWRLDKNDKVVYGI